ncbi:hypothetical protein GDO86_017683 [Hymenochirus boettgeri]|uniref:Olfactory receptor n=1 Tax=Hymenochirus boettgeri TaxID=247094 RepID=A0A8T2ISS0_9PIPI|nr:hypothetical protein GDO86_017683 [Hymenochirus boettgeri]
MKNQTTSYTLVLSSVSNVPSLQLPLFLVFLLVYLMTLTGNLLIVLLICTDSHLQTPMYFFLGTLACLDMSYSSVTTPRMLYDLLSQKKIISLQACLAQNYFFMFCAMSEISLLAVMSYDRYVAICHPLHYTQIMKGKTCLLLISGVCICGIAVSLLHTSFLLKLTFCSSRPLQSFFCDLPQLLLVSCSDKFANEFIILLLGILFGLGVLGPTFCPYIFILNSIIKLQSNRMRSKAFSTCSSHLTVVFIYYMSLYFNYFNPNISSNFRVERVSSICYTVLTPLLNPIIYSLRNLELKTSLKRCLLNIKKNTYFNG